MNELLWVAVPNGLRSPSKALIRVLVVPRLEAGFLGDYGLQDWPATLAEASFALRTRTSAGDQTASRPPAYVARARSEVWEAFFGGGAGTINDFVAKTNPAPTVSSTYQDSQAAVRGYRSVTRVAANPANDVDAAIRSELRRWEATEPAQPPPQAGSPAFETPDFHATVARLREHPTVLFDLGLVFELIVDVADLDHGTAAAGRQLSIQCVDPPFLEALVVSPWTRYDLTSTDFRPAPAPGSPSGIRHGLLDLEHAASLTSPTAPADPGRWAIATFDPDGISGSLRQAGRDLVANPRVPAAMPSMRSVGLALLRPNRQRDFNDRARVVADRAARSLDDAVFSAEDLVLGYRVDIRRGDGAWLSLCERDAKYTIGDIPIGTAGPPNDVEAGTAGPPAGFVREEGHVKAFAALRDGNGELHADEVVLRWDGWSLALPALNLRGDTSGPARNLSQLLPYEFTWEFEIPAGRLPALRFAERYEMRIRVADLTGGGLGRDEVKSDVAASDTLIYRRHDPLQPPQLRAGGQFAIGAAIDRLVIRSDVGLTAAQLQAAHHHYPARETRTLDPPTASLQLIEQHRIFDDRSDPDSFELARRAMYADAAGSGLPDPAAEGVNAFIPAEPGGLSAPVSVRSAWRPGWPNQRPKTIELTEHENLPVPVTIKWDLDDRNLLKVTLAKAEQATIELSSTIRDDMEDHFAVTDDLSSGTPVPSEQTMIGRNRIVTPPRRIFVVHAVRRPLADPAWNHPVTVERVVGDTTAVLRPTFTAATSGPGLNTDSTGRLDVAASWTEFEDVGAEAGSGQRPVTVTHLHNEAIARGDPPAMKIRHEFGDTKHRTVTYTLNATTRYREYFEADEPESWFQRSLSQAPVNIRSTARPPAPVVLGIVPAFRWTRTQTGANRIEHTRRSQVLRVELARPWFETGEGEQLAIILAPSDSSVAAASDLVTRIGRDPLFGTPATPPRPAANWFPTGGAPQTVTLPELNAPVIVIPFDVFPSGDRWSADIEFAIPAGAQSYNPFVQLAVARYQRHTIDAVPKLSPVVITDRAPLLPDRHVVLTRAGNQLDLSVDGVSPNPLNRLEAMLESCDPNVDPETIDLIVDDPAAEPGMPAWRPVSGGMVVRTATGTIPLLTLEPTPGRLRVRLRETENLNGIDSSSPPDLRHRNVFVDTIILPREWQPT